MPVHNQVHGGMELLHAIRASCHGAAMVLCMAPTDQLVAASPPAPSPLASSQAGTALGDRRPGVPPAAGDARRWQLVASPTLVGLGPSGPACAFKQPGPLDAPLLPQTPRLSGGAEALPHGPTALPGSPPARISRVSVSTSVQVFAATLLSVTNAEQVRRPGATPVLGCVASFAHSNTSRGEVAITSVSRLVVALCPRQATS